MKYLSIFKYRFKILKGVRVLTWNKYTMLTEKKTNKQKKPTQPESWEFCFIQLFSKDFKPRR